MRNDPKIVTFYSYKGGVGRSMALANVACLLAEKYNVIVIDWDLEAPDLHRYFNISQENIKYGLIDLFYDYKDLLRKENIPTNGELVYIENYLVKITQKSDFGSLFLLPAGSFNENYAKKVDNFNWDDFYDNWYGYSFVEYFKKQLKKWADFILVDSKTGFTGTSGICTIQMPDAVVLLFSFNEQNIYGIEATCNKIIKTKESLKEEAPKLILIPSRIEKYLEHNILNCWAQKASMKLAKYVNVQKEETPLEHMEKNLIPYAGYYSFGERIINRNYVDLALYESYKNLENLILNLQKK